MCLNQNIAPDVVHYKSQLIFIFMIIRGIAKSMSEYMSDMQSDKDLATPPPESCV